MKQLFALVRGKGIRRYFVILGLVGILATVAYAGSVPNTFTSGTTIKSSEVNANFSYLGSRCFDLNGSNLYYTGGNVGIGTSSPGATFEVSGSLPVIRVHTGTNHVDQDRLLELMPQDTSHEGGQLLIKGASNNQDWSIDTYNGILRIFEPYQSRSATKTRGSIVLQVQASSGENIGTGIVIDTTGYVRNR